MASRALSFFLFLAGVYRLCASLAPNPPDASFQPSTWEDIPASTDKISWWRCPQEHATYSRTRCMRLEVALDYEDPQAGTTTIAFMKHLAAHKSADGLEVIYNPGGPGAGIDITLRGIDRLRKELGTSNDIIVFDPRGVGRSGPKVDCVDGDELLHYQLASAIYPHTLKAALAKGALWGESCEKNLDVSARYISTPAVARDMLTYVERQAATQGLDSAEAKVNFYGKSYGTVIGATFATLYPDFVGRFALDGVVQGKSWYDNWDCSPDEDEVFFQFFRQCSEAGRKSCKFWAGSAEDTKARFDRLLEGLNANPLQIHYSAVELDVPPHITADFVLRHVIGASYQGHDSFWELAWQLAELERGNYRPLLQQRAVPLPSCSMCTLKDWWELTYTFVDPTFNDANPAVKCIDHAPLKIDSMQDFEDLLTMHQNSTRYFSDYARYILAQCLKWPYRPPPSQQFDGNYGANLDQPMLILTSTFDPVTPAVYAREMASQFPGSILVENSVVGHCASGTCIDGVLNSYFEHGELPEPGTICKPDHRPSLHGRFA